MYHQRFKKSGLYNPNCPLVVKLWHRWEFNQIYGFWNEKVYLLEENGGYAINVMTKKKDVDKLLKDNYGIEKVKGIYQDDFGKKHIKNSEVTLDITMPIWL